MKCEYCGDPSKGSYCSDTCKSLGYDALQVASFFREAEFFAEWVEADNEVLGAKIKDLLKKYENEVR